jgi:hypothetical protein
MRLFLESPESIADRQVRISGASGVQNAIAYGAAGAALGAATGPLAPVLGPVGTGLGVAYGYLFGDNETINASEVVRNMLSAAFRKVGAPMTMRGKLSDIAMLTGQYNRADIERVVNFTRQAATQIEGPDASKVMAVFASAQFLPDDRGGWETLLEFDVSENSTNGNPTTGGGGNPPASKSNAGLLIAGAGLLASFIR